MSPDELQILESLDAILGQRALRARIDVVVGQVEQELMQSRGSVMAWRPLPLSIYCKVPLAIRSSWVFILRAGATTGAERHPNSHQRVMSYRGCGDLQTNADGQWSSNQLISDPMMPLARRWASIPMNVWHQAVVPDENWVVVSFHTVLAHELVEERLDGNALRQRFYLAKEDQ